NESGVTEHTYTYNLFDPGTDTITAHPSCGTGGTLVAGSDSNTNTGGTFKCKFLDGPASPTVSVYGTDEDAPGNGNPGNTQSIPVTVANVAPTTSGLTGDATANESGVTEHTYTYNLFDPGTDTITAHPSCGTGGTLVAGSDSNTNTGGTFKCKFLDGPASPTVSVYGTDEDAPGNGNPGNTQSIPVTVANVAPTTSGLTGDATANESGVTEHTYTYNLFDPGTDTITAHPSCGTGGTLVAGSDSNTNTGGTFKCKFLDGPASPTVSVYGTDEDSPGNGNPGNTQSIPVTVANVAPTIAISGNASVN